MPELLEYQGFVAYRRTDIAAEIGEAAYKRFSEWMVGQTCPISEDDRAEPFDLVYAGDYERWRRHPNARPLD